MHGIGEGGGLHPRALKCVWAFGCIAWKADPCPIMLGPFGWLAVGHGFQSRSCQRCTPSLSQTERNRKNASRKQRQMTIMTDVGRRAMIQPYLRLAGVPLDPQWPDFHRNHYIGMRLSPFFGRGERIRNSDPHTPSVLPIGRAYGGDSGS